MSQTPDVAAFMAQLLTPVSGVLRSETIADSNLRAEAEAIEEAIERVSRLTACRDACAPGTRAREVHNIMLGWWAKELADLIGFKREGY